MPSALRRTARRERRMERTINVAGEAWLSTAAGLALAPPSASAYPAVARWKRLASRSGMKVLVTGGAGFIGAHVARHLLDAGHDVVVLDDLSGAYEANVPDAAA